jgi:D-alanyl-D-alanine carboxypeptidase
MRGVMMGRGLRVVISGALSLVLGLSAMSESADARTRKSRPKAARVVPAYSPPYAALVVDLNTGKTLYSKNENDLRHPASVTKVMTLYMLFEQLERGKMTLESDIEMTAHAASMEPSKLGLRPGQTISVENAIKAVVTKSANDVAAAIADNIGGSEERFAEMMTAKARQLGMSRTVYVNASGLPDEEQVTTARDLVTLGRAIQERFPKYYRYFSTHNFRYGRANMANHNHLLGPK